MQRVQPVLQGNGLVSMSVAFRSGDFTGSVVGIHHADHAERRHSLYVWDHSTVVGCLQGAHLQGVHSTLHVSDDCDLKDVNDYSSLRLTQYID